MSVYMTEEEQLANIKRWWQKHQQVIMTVVCLLLLIYSGVKYWSMHQQKVAQQASIAYEQLMFATMQNDHKHMNSYIDQIVTEYPQTVYADAAFLMLARMAVNDKNELKAREALTHVIKHAKRKALQDEARIRLARLDVDAKQYSHALAELKKIHGVWLRPSVQELRGDIYVAMKQEERAKMYYQKARDAFHAAGIRHAFLEMKWHALGAPLEGHV